MLQLGCTANEYKNRVSAVQAAMKQKDLDAFIFWNGTSVFYLCGFAFIATKRPMCLILGKDGKKTMFVPRLEVEHAEESPQVDSVIHYLEYPTEKHPLNVLAEKLAELGYAKANLGADADGYGSAQGYKGPRLSDVLPDAKITVMRDLVERQRAVKSPEEIALIKESARWGNLAHALLQEYSLPGRTENEISMRASLEATTMMIKTLGRSYSAASAGRAGASAGFRGQIGANSALPHAITINAVLKRGDVLVTFHGRLRQRAGKDHVRPGSKRREAQVLRPHDGHAGHRFRGDPPGRQVLGRRQGGQGLLRQAQPLGVLEAPHRPRPRPFGA